VSPINLSDLAAKADATIAARAANKGIEVRPGVWNVVASDAQRDADAHQAFSAAINPAVVKALCGALTEAINTIKNTSAHYRAYQIMELHGIALEELQP